eukprot:g5263.t1
MRYCLWVDSMDVWDNLLVPSIRNLNDEENASSTASPCPFNITQVANQFVSGILLCRIVARFSDSSHSKKIFKLLHEKPSSRRNAISNIEKGLTLAYAHSPRARFMPTAEEIYEARPNKIALMLRELCHACAIRDAWQNVRVTMRWLSKILSTFGRPLSSATLRGNTEAMWRDFRDGVAIACILFWFRGDDSVGDDKKLGRTTPLPTVDLSRIYASSEGGSVPLNRVCANLRYIFDLLFQTGIEVVWQSDDFASFPNDDFLVLQLHNIRTFFQSQNSKGQTTTRPSGLRWLTRSEASSGVVGILTTIDNEDSTLKVQRVCNVHFAEGDPATYATRAPAICTAHPKEGIPSTMTKVLRSRPSPVSKAKSRVRARGATENRAATSDAEIHRLIHNHSPPAPNAQVSTSPCRHGGWPHARDDDVRDHVLRVGRGRDSGKRDTPKTSAFDTRRREDIRELVERERRERFAERFRKYGILSPAKPSLATKPPLPVDDGPQFVMENEVGDEEEEEEEEDAVVVEEVEEEEEEEEEDEEEDIMKLSREIKRKFFRDDGDEGDKTLPTAEPLGSEMRRVDHGINLPNIPGLWQLADACSDSSQRLLHGRLVRGPACLFDAMDTNGDGTVSLEELCGAVERLDIALTDRQCVELFTFMDHDGDGTIDVVEFETALRGDNLFVRGRRIVYPREHRSMQKRNEAHLTKLRETLYSVQRELIEREEEIALLGNPAKDSFRQKMEREARIDEIDQLKRERDDLIASLKRADEEEQRRRRFRVLNDDIAEDGGNGKAEKEEEENERHLVRASSSSPKTHHVSTEGEHKLSDLDANSSKHAPEDVEMILKRRLEEEKSKWMIEHEARLEAFERKIKEKFEAEKRDMIKQLREDVVGADFVGQRSEEVWKRERRRLEDDRDAFLADEIELRKQIRTHEIKGLVSGKETRLMALEDSRMEALAAQHQRESVDAKKSERSEVEAVVRWLAAPKVVTFRLHEGGEPVSALLSLMRVTPTGFLPALRVGDALVLRWSDVGNRDVLGCVAVIGMLSLIPPTGSVLSLRFCESQKDANAVIEEVVFSFNSADTAHWYYRGLKTIREFENRAVFDEDDEDDEGY